MTKVTARTPPKGADRGERTQIKDGPDKDLDLGKAFAYIILEYSRFG